MCLVKLEGRSVSILGLDEAVLNTYLLLWLLQVLYLCLLPERETQAKRWCSTGLVTMACYISVYMMCRATYIYMRTLQKACVILSMIYRMLKPKKLSATLLIEPCSIILMMFSTCVGYMLPEETANQESIVLINYLYWLTAWIYFIHRFGSILEELRHVGTRPRVRTRPKRMKCRKLRRPRLPFYKRNWHRKFGRLRASKPQVEVDAWADDNDPLRDLQAFPYWKYLHQTNMAEYWDDLCSTNPDLVTFALKDSFFNLMPSGLVNKRVLDLGLTVGTEVFNLTKATDISGMFRFHSIFHVQSSERGAPIIFDSVASISISPYLEDFIGDLDTSPDMFGGAKLLGVSSGTAIKGVGKVRLLVHTDTGSKRELVTRAYYVPDARVRLLSICRYREEYPGEGCSFRLDDHGCAFQFPRSSGGGRITFQYRGTNYIPQTTAYSQQFGKSNTKAQTFMELEDSNMNLTLEQKELL